MKIEERGTHWAVLLMQMMPVWIPNSVHVPFLSFLVIQINKPTDLVLESDDAEFQDYWYNSTGNFHRLYHSICLCLLIYDCQFVH